MLKNNNSSAVKRLTKRSVKNNRTRNIFAVIAIILTTYMISTIFSIGVSFVKSYTTMTRRMDSTTASIMLNNPTDQQVTQIKKISGVKAAGIQILVGAVYEQDTPDTVADAEESPAPIIGVVYLDATEFEKNRLPCISNIKGKYPHAKDEIMMSLAALEKLGITEPTVGMKVSLTYTGQQGQVAEVFRLSGYYTDYTKHIGGSPLALVSKAYSDILGLTAQQHGQLCITPGILSESKVYKTIEAQVKLDNGQELRSTFDPMSEALTSILGAGGIIIMLVLFIVLSGYLLIYNVIYISVTKDTRFFGLLKTIGTSPKQIKKIVRNQIYLLSLIGIPIGIGLGIASSFLIVPYALHTFTSGTVMNNLMPTEISFHPTIFMGTSFFALLTIALASRRPAKLAAKTAPVEALHYTGITQQKNLENRKSTKGGKPYKMAWYNVFREKRRAILVFASLFMGTITFLSVNSFISSLGVENYINRYHPHDFVLDNYSHGTQTFTKDFVEAAKKIDGINKFEIKEQSIAQMEVDEALLDPIFKENYSRYYGPENGTYEDFIQILKNNNNVPLAGIDPDYVTSYNEKYQTDLDPDAFERGEYGFLGYTWGVNREKYMTMVGKDITLTNPDTGEQKTIKIGGIFEYNDCPISQISYSTGLPDGFFISHNALKSLIDDPVISTIYIDVDRKKEPRINQALKALQDRINGTSYSMTARSDTEEEFSNTMQSTNVMGAGVSALLISIGLINFVNVMLTGVYIRRKELAVLESVGMTKKQIAKMLTFEGLYYALISAGLIMTLGNLALWFMAKNVSYIADYAVFHYPFAVVAGIFSAIFAVCLIVPALVFRTLSKESVTQRLHDNQE